MIRHWWQSTFLLLALFALAACSGVATDAESTSVEVPSMAPSLPTSSPEPSATPFPTATALLTPTPQPRLTSTPELTATPKPTEIPPSPTPEQSFQAWGTWPSQAEISTALEVAPQNTFPLKLHEFGLPWYVLNGVITNPRYVNLIIADRFEITQAIDLFFTNGNLEKKVSMPLSAYDRVEDRWISFIAGSTEDGVMPPDTGEIVFDYQFGNNTKPLEPRTIFFRWQNFENFSPPHFNGGIGQPDFVALIHGSLGVTEADVEMFRNTGEISHLPLIDGERWLFPNQTSN